MPPSRGNFLENFQIVPAIMPIDLNTGANAGDWVSLKGYGRCVIVFLASAGTAGDDPIFKLQQATAVAGTSAKDLLFDTIYVKAVAATLLSAVGAFAKVSQTAATSYTDATHAEIQKMYAVEVFAEDLDAENGFDCVQLSVADTGTAAQIGCAFYILGNTRYSGSAMPSAIVD